MRSISWSAGYLNCVADIDGDDLVAVALDAEIAPRLRVRGEQADFAEVVLVPFDLVRRAGWDGGGAMLPLGDLVDRLDRGVAH